MSMNEKSKLEKYIENLERRTESLEEKVKEMRRHNDEIKEVRVIGLDFKDKCESGVEKILTHRRSPKRYIYSVWEISSVSGSFHDFHANEVKLMKPTCNG